MIRQIAYNLIERQERVLGVPLEHLRHVADHSLVVLGKIALLAPAGTHRSKLPADAFHLARLQATLHEDCGSCVEIQLNLARRDLLPESVLRAVLEGRLDDLPPDLASVCRFAEAVVTHNGDESHLREHLVRRYGEEEVIELALAIAMARVFPTLKRGLGQAVSCSHWLGRSSGRSRRGSSPGPRHPEAMTPFAAPSHSNNTRLETRPYE